MRNHLAIAALAAVMVAPAGWAQTGAGARSSDPAPTKIGVLNMSVAIQSTQEGKQDASELQAKFAPRQQELQNLQKQIQDIQTRLQTAANTLSDAEKYRLADEGQRLQREAQRKQQEAQADYQDANDDLINQLGRKLMTVLDKYSRQNGYAVIIDTSSQQTPVIYNAPAINITEDIVKLYDQTYPVKASASPSGSGTKQP
ncbi:MAG TPA: OmpH family outer membrane protein [Candidatus Acidoferrum sp.]|nr:OmpH family outer membrane protein [Candidatus Acidoferrum sp.]